MCILDRIVPVPQQFAYLQEELLVLGYLGWANYAIEADVPADAMLANNAVVRLKEGLERLISVTPCHRQAGVTIILSLGDAPAGVKNPDQGYAIKAAQGRISLVGFGQLGLYYAVTTLLQCLRLEDGKVAVPAFEVLDYPNFKTRGHFLETRYGSNLMELGDWKQVIDDMVSKKQNQLTVSVYGCWVVQFDGLVSEYVYVPIHKYPDLKTPVINKYYSPKAGAWVTEEKLTPMYRDDFLGELIVYGKTKGVEVLPMFNSFGHNTLIPRLYPEVSAKEEDGTPTGTGFCTSNPKTYEMLFNIYDEIIDRHLKPNGITSFDIGLDEVGEGRGQHPVDPMRIRSPWCCCPECLKKERAQRFIDHAITLIKYLKSKGMTTIYMYNDMLAEHKNVKTKGRRLGDNCEKMMEALKANDLLENVCIDWWNYTSIEEKMHYHSIRPQLGLRNTMKPWNGYHHWSFLEHAVKNAYMLSEMGNREGAEGMRSYSAWDKSYDRTHEAQSDYAWNFQGTGDVLAETERYARRHFPAYAQEAVHAFDLMEKSVLRVNTANEGETRHDRYTMFFEDLTYYRSSYVKRDCDYPRNFPGEAVGRIRQDAGYVPDLEEISTISGEAARIFAKCAEDMSCDTHMAKRYQYESLNIQNLADDMIAIMKMDNLAATFMEKKTEALRDEISRLAKERMDARKYQLAMLENLKEHYLVPFHARNQCVHMQFFVDLAAYLANTPLDEIRLDFSDSRHFASPAFMQLR